MQMLLLLKLVEEVPKHDLLVVMGDLNAKVGRDNTGLESIMGKQGIGEMNENGERLTDFCLHQNLVIGGTVFMHKDIHKYTWTSPNGKTKNQIDHILYNRKWKTSIQDVVTRRRPDVGSDHNMVTCKLKLKLRRTKKKISSPMFDSSQIRSPEVKEKFCLELRNRFEPYNHLPEAANIEEEWARIKDSYCNAAETILGRKKPVKEEWISKTSWTLIEERRTLKGKINLAKKPNRGRNCQRRI